MVESALELVGDLVAFRSSGHSTHAFIIFIFLGRARWVFRSLLLLRRLFVAVCVVCFSGEEHHSPEYIQLLYCLWLLFEKRTLAALEQSNKQTHKHAHMPPPSRHDAPPDKKKSEIRKSGARKMSISRANFFFSN